jgi:pimeloyl-ACP methyl ester carboxylesterase
VPFARARDGTRLQYDVSGGGLGAPAVLLVMGLTLRGEVWGETRDRLAGAGYRTITMDNRGAGASRVPTSIEFSTAMMAADCVAVLREAFVARAHVVGVSLGGMVAQELALGYPGRVGALVLQSTTAGRPRVHDVAPALGLRSAAVLRARLTRDRERRERILLRVLTTRAFAAGADLGAPPVRALLDGLDERVTVGGYLGQVVAASRHGAWRRLRRVAAPTLVQHGTRDVILRAAGARALATRIPGARLEVYEDAGHALAVERPEAVASALAFLREHDALLARAG